MITSAGLRHVPNGTALQYGLSNDRMHIHARCASLRARKPVRLESMTTHSHAPNHPSLSVEQGLTGTARLTARSARSQVSVANLVSGLKSGP